jgi:hypothetical protein
MQCPADVSQMQRGVKNGFGAPTGNVGQAAGLPANRRRIQGQASSLPYVAGHKLRDHRILWTIIASLVSWHALWHRGAVIYNSGAGTSPLIAF